MTRGLSGPLSDGVELAALRGRVAMVEAKLVAVRAARHRLTAEVEQLRVACLYQEDLSPSAGDRLPLRRPGRPARGRAGAWASKGLGLPAGKVARLLGQLGVTIPRVG